MAKSRNRKNSSVKKNPVNKQYVKKVDDFIEYIKCGLDIPNKHKIEYLQKFKSHNGDILRHYLVTFNEIGGYGLSVNVCECCLNICHLLINQICDCEVCEEQISAIQYIVSNETDVECEVERRLN